MIFKHLNSKNLYLLTSFLDGLGEIGRKSFRYFESRPLDIVCTHEVAVIIVGLDNVPIAYGHLEFENGLIWLGVAVQESFRGLGYGKMMMNYLIEQSIQKKIKSIHLTVDLDNINAIKLYQSLGFQIVLENSKHIKMCLTHNEF